MALTKVTLREKKLSSGKVSLYLDFYPPIIHPVTGKQTRREFTGLLLTGNKKVDAASRHTAELLLSQRRLDVHNDDLGFMDKTKQNANLLEIFLSEVDKREGKTYDVWLSSYSYLRGFIGSDEYRFKDVNVAWCDEYRQYMIGHKKLAHNSASLYFSKFKAVLRHAYKLDYTAVNFADKVDAITMKAGHPVHLSSKERTRLYEDYKKQKETIVLQRAALFSMFTGLRFTDIMRLEWSNVEGNTIHFEQKKTGTHETIIMPEQAREFMQGKDRPFEGLAYRSEITWMIRTWLQAVGIDKQVTFHSFRHTYAVWALENGDDIYTVSKGLGHSSVATTENRYAQFTDRMKAKSAERRVL